MLSSLIECIYRGLIYSFLIAWINENHQKLSISKTNELRVNYNASNVDVAAKMKLRLETKIRFTDSLPEQM